ncbi:MAG: mannose-1-phosphate guanylyltransferase [Verrucomicrobia bacterium]|nr:mannose-1-phosphate guanylyltransferase [Verrucomicrobiota bacterium]
MKIVILAGGEGSRLWPLSLRSHPKPLLRLGGTYSLLQKTLLRFLGAYDSSSIVVVTSEISKTLVQEQCNEVDPEKKISILTESIGKSTAPALALAFCFLKEEKKIDPLEPVLIVPSDGLISPLDNFLEKISLAQKRAREGFIVLFGVTPTKAETSYGYIRLGTAEGHFFKDNQFIEKPSKERAQKLILEERVLWNTGHLLLTAKTFWKEMMLHSPEIGNLEHLSLEKANEELMTLPSISIDYALLEKSQKVLACDMQVAWSDLGTWDRVYEAFEKDEKGNVQIGDIIDLESKNCFFLSDKKKVVTIGLEDMVVIATEEALFLAKKDQSYKIKEILKQLEELKMLENNV